MRRRGGNLNVYCSEKSQSEHTSWMAQLCTQKIRGCQEEGEGGTGGAEDLQGSKLASCVTAQWTHIRIYLSKPRGNPHENHGLWVMCECRFMNCNKCPLWLGC